MDTKAHLQEVRAAYLTLLKRCLTRVAFPEVYRPIAGAPSSFKAHLNALVQGRLRVLGYELVRRVAFDETLRERGADWPADAETMIGLLRLDNLEDCIVRALEDDVAGDLVETGVWRGGAAVFMRAVLAAYGDQDRLVWAADSFEGLPAPDGDRYPADSGSRLHANPYLAVSLEEVRANFGRYGLLDERVRFLKGWFRDSLPNAPIEQIAVLRLDGDLYESTMDALTHLYEKVSPGGFVIIDDYHSNKTCRLAVDDYRAAHRVRESMADVDADAVFWRKDQA